MAEFTSGGLKRQDEFMRRNTTRLLETIMFAVKAAGLANSDGDALWEAREILAAAHQRALATPLETDSQPNLMSWMMFLACDVLIERQEERSRLLGTSPSSSAVSEADRQRAADADGRDFDWVMSINLARSSYDPRITAEARAEFERQLALVDATSRLVLRLAILSGLDSEYVASELHCSPGEARLRFHDAFTELRRVWERPSRSFDR